MAVGNGTWETAIEVEGSHQEETETSKLLYVTKTLLVFCVSQADFQEKCTKSCIVKVR